MPALRYTPPDVRCTAAVVEGGFLRHDGILNLKVKIKRPGNFRSKAERKSKSVLDRFFELAESASTAGFTVPIFSSAWLKTYNASKYIAELPGPNRRPVKRIFCFHSADPVAAILVSVDCPVALKTRYFPMTNIAPFPSPEIPV